MKLWPLILISINLNIFLSVASRNHGEPCGESSSCKNELICHPDTLTCRCPSPALKWDAHLLKCLLQHGAPCNNNTSQHSSDLCNYGQFLRCHPQENTCECLYPSSWDELSGKCVFRYGESCVPKLGYPPCSPRESLMCTFRNKCDCVPPSSWDYNTDECTLLYDQPCEFNGNLTTCNSGKFLECSQDSETCTCKSGGVWNDVLNVCTLELGAVCDPKDGDSILCNPLSKLDCSDWTGRCEVSEEKFRRNYY